MHHLKYIFVVLGLAMIFSCTKPPEYPIEPTLTYKGASATQFSRNLNDTISLTFEFTDGDGNLGNEEEGFFDLRFRDLRDNSQTLEFSVPKVPEQGANNGISGEITVFTRPFLAFRCRYPDGFVLEPNVTDPDLPFDTLQFEVVLLDRDSNMSEPVITEPLILICD